MGLPGRIITPNHTNFNRTYFTQSRSKSTDVDNILRQFWEIEETPSRDYGTMNAEVHLAVNKVKNSMKYQDGRYQVAIPWKKDPSNLPENYDMALKRLKHTEKRLAKDPELSGAYSNVILQYLAKKYIQKVPKEEPRPSCVWYLPHFSVLRPDKYDEYEFSRVVFGTSSSPFLAQFILQQHALKNKDSYPLAADTVENATYMDNSMDSAVDDNQAIELYRELKELYEKADMHPHKWLSNSRAVLEQIPLQERASAMHLDDGQLPSIKPLVYSGWQRTMCLHLRVILQKNSN